MPYTKFEHFGIIRFLVMLQTDKQTERNKQTDSKILPTPTDIFGVGIITVYGNGVNLFPTL